MKINVPNHKGWSAEEIASSPFADSAGHLLRAMAWLDYFQRKPSFSVLVYACAEGRHAIEYILFEELVVSTGFNLPMDEYKKCVGESTSFKKIIKRLSPNYQKHREFTALVLSLEPPHAPKPVHWDHGELMKAWGVLSESLHWVGANNLAGDNADWLAAAYKKANDTIAPLWGTLTSGHQVIFPVESMKPAVREIWEEFSAGKIDASAVKFRLEYIRPIVR